MAVAVAMNEIDASGTDSAGSEFSAERIFHALSDTTRRRLLDDLYERDGQRPVELSTRYFLSRQAVLKHLGVLEDAGLVTVERHRGKTLYHLNRAPFRRLHTGWIAKFTAEDPGDAGIQRPR
jgi:DNA-binding transcriptional ArsR family regulator